MEVENVSFKLKVSKDVEGKRVNLKKIIKYRMSYFDRKRNDHLMTVNQTTE
jgi:hypothetical protein